MRSDLEKLDSFTLETSKNPLSRNFLRNGRLRVKYEDCQLFHVFFERKYQYQFPHLTLCRNTNSDDRRLMLHYIKFQLATVYMLRKILYQKGSIVQKL